MALLGRVKRFLSPSEYESGRAAGVWACVYLAVTALAIISSGPKGNGGDDLMMGLATLATLPLSIFVPTASEWMLPALAVCALVNAFVFWLVFRGSAHYPRPRRTLQVPVAAGRKGRSSSKRATRKELGDSLHPRKKPGEGYGWFN